MLTLSHHLFGRHHATTHSVKFAQAPAENDELINAIDSDHDATWTLDSTPDAHKLDEFWTGVEQDLKKDPEWFNFSDE